MTAADAPNDVVWADAVLAATLFAVDPVGTVGIAVRARVGPVRDRWLALLRDLLPTSAPVRRVPLHIGDGRLLGGLDLTATLQAGRPVAERGLLAEADGGVAVLAMAERLAPTTAARLGIVLDSGEVVLERDGLALRAPTRFGVLALDEGVAEDERPPPALLDRLAFHLDLGAIALRQAAEPGPGADAVALARSRHRHVVVDDDCLEALCAASMALGISSMRPPLLALRVARVAAALAGRDAVTEADVVQAGRLVLAPRAAALPAVEPPPMDDEEMESGENGESPPTDDEGADESAASGDRPLEDIVLEAAQAAIPEGLLARLRLAGGARRRTPSAGKSGVLQSKAQRGRPAGVTRGDPRSGARLSVVETLRAAAPWQRLRRRACDREEADGRLLFQRDDLRIARFKRRTETVTIFVVDASGSSALHRLAEAKGAVELLLADCYVRRDHVALVAFRGAGAELVLPPSRSLVRAKRSLAGLAGGGGTPLAEALDAAVALAEAVRRKGQSPTIVLLTDGRANVGRGGQPGRVQGEEDALHAARCVRASEVASLLIDTSPRARPFAERLATEMNALYVPLPHADASALSSAVRAATDPDKAQPQGISRRPASSGRA